MRLPARFAVAILIVGLAAYSPARSNAHVRIPQDVSPPFYTNVPPGFIHDEEWAAIPFFRPPGCVPEGFNLLDYFDPAAVECPLLVEGFAEFADLSDRGPLLTEARGLGAVPIWFVSWSEIQAAVADGILIIGELASLPSLLRGTADRYNEQNHLFRLHQVSHLALVAGGVLEDGRAFALQAVEVDLELVRIRIRFGNDER